MSNTLRPHTFAGRSSWIGLAFGLACGAGAFAQQTPNWGAPGGAIGTSSKTVGTAAGTATAAQKAWAGQSSTGISGPVNGAAGSTGPTGRFNAGTSGISGAAPNAPGGAAIGQRSNIGTPGGGTVNLNQVSQSQIGASQVSGAASGVGVGSSGGGGVNQFGGQGVNLNNGGRAAVSEDPSTSTGGGTVSGETGTAGAGGTAGSAGTAGGSDPEAQASAMSNGLKAAWAATVNAVGTSAPSTTAPHQAAGVRGEDSPVETYGGGANAAGQTINKGNGGLGDAGGGSTEQGGAAGGGANAQGRTFNAGAIAGGDAPLHRPAQGGVLNTGKLTNGVTDPSPKSGTTRNR